MQRVLSLWFPAWSVDLIRRRQRRLRDVQNLRRPVLLVTQTAGRELVAVCSSNAQKKGVQVGMTLSQARALLSPEEALVDVHRPLRELRALEALAAWSMRFSPVVAVDEPDGMARPKSPTTARRVPSTRRYRRRRRHRIARKPGLHRAIAAYPARSGN